MNNNSHLVINYWTLRKAVGFLGILLPWVLVIGSIVVYNCPEIQDSISKYYHTRMRNVFVGTLCAVALFLLSYKGFDKKDSLWSNIAGFAALGIAIFPTAAHSPAPPCNVDALPNPSYISMLHWIFSLVFFGALIYMSLVLFTKSSQPKPYPPKKRIRNTIYRICGWVMLVCILLIAVYVFWVQGKNPAIDALDPIFWLEAIALTAFGLSWLTKGEAIFGD